MPWRPAPHDRFYRLIVRTGLFLRWAFRIRVISTGTGHLPPAGLRSGVSRAVVPGTGAVFAVTHFGYLDFAVAELLLWKHATGAAAVPDPPGCGRPLVRGPGGQRRPATWWWGTPTGPAPTTRPSRSCVPASTWPSFPEAGVSRSFTVRGCRTGAVRMAAEAGVPVIPVSVWGAHRLLTRGHGFSLRRDLARTGADPCGRDAVTVCAGCGRRGGHRVRCGTCSRTGIDRCIADFPLQPEPRAWWMPAHRAGSAPTEAERKILDATTKPAAAVVVPAQLGRS